MHEAVMGSSQNQGQSLLSTKNTGHFFEMEFSAIYRNSPCEKMITMAFGFEKVVGGIGLEPMTPCA